MIVNLLELFWAFFKIGAFTFGGGYAMIPLMEQAVVPKYISYELFTDMIAISESTPGPFAINMATFIGTEESGIIGAFFATLGVVLPSFIIILLIAILGANFLKNKHVKAAFYALRPAAVGLIIVAVTSLFFKLVFPGLELKNFSFKELTQDFQLIPLIIILIVFAISKIFKKLNPIYLILISGVLGLIFYGLPHIV